MPKTCLTYLARCRARDLLNMPYKPSELAAELSVPVKTIYWLVESGLPHSRDKDGHLWVLGLEVRRWLEDRKPPRWRLKPDEGYCLRCRQAVPLVNPRRLSLGKYDRLQAVCPQCGRTISRDAKRYDPA